MPSHFQLSRLDKTETDTWGGWKKTTCFKVENFKNNPEETWVEVTRMDEARKSMGILGLWNPYANYPYPPTPSDAWMKVSRKAKVYYNIYPTYRPKIELQ
jgi:hypothetical protein